jgi:uncharacterized cupin superfamily protein
VTQLARLNRDAAPPEVQRPAPERLVSGDPVHTTWNLEDRDGLYCGLWQSTPGAWRVSYSEWEYVHVREGISVLHEDGQPPVTFRAGDSFVIRPGFEGVWEVVETTLKDYVIRT